MKVTKWDRFLTWAITVPPVNYAAEISEQVIREGTGKDLNRLSAYQAINYLDAGIVGLARLRGYMEGWKGQVGHRESVRLSNHLVREVRKALGYVNPRQDLQF